jgi:hypothetical protein
MQNRSIDAGADRQADKRRMFFIAPFNLITPNDAFLSTAAEA